MNRDAERHVAQAARHVERGENYYRKAAAEIAAARAADPSLTYRAIGDGVGRSHTWVRRLVEWHESGKPDFQASPDWQRGSHGTVAERRKGAEKLLRDAPLEQVEQMIETLPRERRQAIAAVAGHDYAKARQEHDEAERRRTPEEQRERDQAGRELARPARQAVGTFAAMGIVEHIEQATDDLRELNADAAVMPDAIGKIERALDAFVAEFNFARAMLGEESER